MEHCGVHCTLAKQKTKWGQRKVSQEHLHLNLFKSNRFISNRFHLFLQVSGLTFTSQMLTLRLCLPSNSNTNASSCFIITNTCFLRSLKYSIIQACFYSHSHGLLLNMTPDDNLSPFTHFKDRSWIAMSNIHSPVCWNLESDPEQNLNTLAYISSQQKNLNTKATGKL